MQHADRGRNRPSTPRSAVNEYERTQLEADFWDELIMLGTPLLFNALLHPIDGMVRTLETGDLHRAQPRHID